MFIQLITNLYDIQHVYPSKTNTYEVSTWKKKSVGCKRDSIERQLVNIYKFWNLDNRFLVGVGFKSLKLKCMLYVLLKHLLLLYLKKLTKTNRLLFLSIEI